MTNQWVRVIAVDLSYSTATVDRARVMLTVSLALLAACLTLGALAWPPPGPALASQAAPARQGAQLWAVLVAGSQGWDNYRHQADVCHAYQVLVNHGLPRTNIITMMYDDLAYSAQNPFPGRLFNRPGGPDVYEGVSVDYKGIHVNPTNFLAVLQGDQAALAGKGSGRVVDSGPNDRIFVYFADHGASGIVAFPSDFLDAQTFNSALQQMHRNKRFQHMLIYLEACESGSMFEGLLPGNIGVMAVTAANSTAPSFACYYDQQLDTFLGDVFSVSWLENADSADIEQETVKQQIEDIDNRTSVYSQIGEFGDSHIEKLIAGKFQGPKSNKKKNRTERITDAVPSYDVPLVRLQQKNNEDELHKLKMGRKFVEDTMDRIIYSVAGESGNGADTVQEVQKIRQFDCYLAAVTAFHQHCFNIGQNGWAARQVNHVKIH